MGFLMGHSAWQIDQFPTCWPMNGLFVHWSRGWGVSSFSERLVIRICTLIVSWHDYFLSGYVLLLFPDMITFYQDMLSNCFLTWLLFIRICTLIVSWLDYFLSGYVLLLFPDVIPFVWCDLDMISVWLACVGKQMAWHRPRPGLGTGWSCSWCPMGHGWSRGQHGISCFTPKLCDSYFYCIIVSHRPSLKQQREGG